MNNKEKQFPCQICQFILNNQQQISMLKKAGRLTKKFLWNIDLFSSSQLLRHKNETNYGTLTGGCLSLTIVIIFGTLLIKDSTTVLSMSEVIAQDSTYYLEDPTFTALKFDSSSNFMIGIGIKGLDLTAQQRYFDISLISLVYRYGKFVSATYENLQPCTYQQWAHINDIGANSYKTLGLNQFLCPSENVTAELQGKYTSQSFKFFEIRISKCNNATDPSRPCVSNQFLANFSTIYTVNYYIMNAYLNSGNIDPAGYYLEDRNYFGFTLDSTTISNIYVTQNIVSTDNSLFPWESIQNNTVFLVKQLAEVKNRVKVQDQYISIYLRKAPYYIVSQRSFRKIQDLLSSVGGLFGFALAFFFFMNFYTEASYQVQMGDKLFFYNSQKPLKPKGFNFFFFIAYLVYELLREVFCIQIPWQRLRIYYECREQIKEQLDVSLLMNKITFLEKCMNVVFEQHQFRAIYLQQKPNVKQAENLRKNHGLNKIIHKNSQKINNKIQQKLKLHKQKLIKKIKGAKSLQRQQLKQDDLISIDTNCKQSKIQKQSKNYLFQQKQNNSIQLNQIIGNFIIQGFMKNDEKQIKNNKIPEVISQMSEQVKTNNQIQSEQHIELEEIAGENHQSLQFVNKALKDIKLVEEQSKKGNVFSQRIYNQLNNDITKQQLIVLKCLQTILNNKPIIENQKIQDHQKLKKTSKKTNLFKSLLKLASQGDSNKIQNQTDGVERALQSNNRIKVNEDF